MLGYLDGVEQRRRIELAVAAMRGFRVESWAIWATHVYLFCRLDPIPLSLFRFSDEIYPQVG